MRSQEVVVAERDLVGGGGVVFVDDRDHPPLEQLAQCLARVEVVRAGAHVKEGQKHLGGGQPALAQELVVDLVELALTDRARGLELVHGPGPQRQ